MPRIGSPNYLHVYGTKGHDCDIARLVGIHPQIVGHYEDGENPQEHDDELYDENPRVGSSAVASEHEEYYAYET